MCIQDIEIMAQSKSNAAVYPVAATTGRIVSAAPDRIGLIFCPHDTVDYWVSIAQDVAVGQGIFVGAANVGGTAPHNGNIMLSIFEHGDMLRRPWFAISRAGSLSVVVFELFINTELSRKTGYGL